VELPALLGMTDFLRGELADAEMEFKKAVRMNDKFGRAWLGLGRVFEAVSLRAKARICYQKAWNEDPNDPEIQQYYARTLAPSDRLAELERSAAGFPGMDPEQIDSVRRQIDELKWTANRKLFAVAATDHAELKLSWLLHNSRQIRGFALPVSINGGKPIHLLMDTGAGGILLNRKAAEAAGLPKISDLKFRGIGDEGDRTGYMAFAETIRIGGITFTECPIGVSEKKFLADEDGLIGPDIFSKFLVTIDLQKLVLRLDPLPVHKAVSVDDAWQDAEKAPQFADYSPFWRSGHRILLPVRVNDARQVLFVVDTGSSTSLIDPDYAARFTSVRSEELVNVKGLSGKVKNVQSTGLLTFEFGHYRQKVPAVLAVPLTKIAQDSPRLTGIFGITTLMNFRMQINYRDGLIDLEYIGPKY
jgi:predicted aspartyl protease